MFLFQSERIVLVMIHLRELSDLRNWAEFSGIVGASFPSIHADPLIKLDEPFRFQKLHQPVWRNSCLSSVEEQVPGKHVSRAVISIFLV